MNEREALEALRRAIEANWDPRPDVAWFEMIDPVHDKVMSVSAFVDKDDTGDLDGRCVMGSVSDIVDEAQRRVAWEAAVGGNAMSAVSVAGTRRDLDFGDVVSELCRGAYEEVTTENVERLFGMTPELGNPSLESLAARGDGREAPEGHVGVAMRDEGAR